jgi:putative ABC transport system permease protein
LALSTAGISFAVLLMLMQLGFRNALVDSQVEVMRMMDCDLVVLNSSKYQLNKLQPFARRRLFQALAVSGVASASPLYIAFDEALWKNPTDQTTHRIRVIGFDPEERVFSSEEINRHVQQLRTPDNILVDKRCRERLGHASAGDTTELARRKVRVVGNFNLGTDFVVDGTIITSDRTFLRMFPDRQLANPQLYRVEVGLLKTKPGYAVEEVKAALTRELPPDVMVMTKEQAVALERGYWMKQTPVGFVFNLGTLVGFIVGVVICSQILFTDLADKMPQFATLKAIGYQNGFLRRVVLQQALYLSLFGFLPGLLLSYAMYQIIGQLTGLLMRMTAELVLAVLILTVAMCLISGLLSVRKVMSADPADVF